MNAVELYKYVGDLSTQVPIVHSFYANDVYSVWNAEEVKYGSIVTAIRSVSNDSKLSTYDVVIYYGDRLNDDKTNVTQIQTDASTVLQSIVGSINQDDGSIYVTYPINITLFEQKFADDLAGAYVELNITAENSVGECGYALLNCKPLTHDDFYTKPEVDERLQVITAMFSNYYLKEEINEMFKNYFTKAEIAEKFGKYYTKDEIAKILDDYYTKIQINDKFKVVNENIDAKDKAIHERVTKLDGVVKANDAAINKRVDDLTIDVNNKDKNVNIRIDNEVETINNRITTEVGTLNQTITDTSDNINNRITTEVGTLNQTITDNVDALNGQILANDRAINKRVDDLTTDVNNNVDVLNRHIADLNTKVEGNDSDINIRVDLLTTKVDDNDKAINDKVNNNDISINSRVDDVTDKVNSLNAKVNKNDDAINNRVSLLDAKVDNNDTAINKRVDDLTTDVNNNDTAINKRVDDLTIDVNNNDTAINKRVDDLTIDVNNNDTAINDALALKADKSEITDMETKTHTAETYQPIGDYATKSELAKKQDQLISGQNIKTINKVSILGGGNIVIDGDGVGKPGIGANSEVFNDYDNNKAEGDYSHAEGGSPVQEDIRTYDLPMFADERKNSNFTKWLLRTDLDDSIFVVGLEVGLSYDTADGPYQDRPTHHEVIVTVTHKGTAYAYDYKCDPPCKYGPFTEITFNETLPGSWGVASHYPGESGFDPSEQWEADFKASNVVRGITLPGAKGNYSHTEGYGTQANNIAEHAEGKFNKSNTNTISSIGIGTSNDNRKNALEVLDNGKVYIKGIGGYDGTNTSSAKDISSAVSLAGVGQPGAGTNSEIFNNYYNNKADGNYSHAEGNGTSAIGFGSHSEGAHTTASGNYSHAEGFTTESNNPKTIGGYISDDKKSVFLEDEKLSLTIGDNIRIIYKDDFHHIPETDETRKITDLHYYYNGVEVYVDRLFSHSIQYAAGPIKVYIESPYKARGYASHAEGYCTTTTNRGEHAEGEYNKSNANTISSIGVGTISNPNNAFEVLTDGKVYIKNVGGYDGTNPNDSRDVASVIGSGGGGGSSITVEDNLTSYYHSNALSANMGRVLNELKADKITVESKADRSELNNKADKYELNNKLNTLLPTNFNTINGESIWAGDGVQKDLFIPAVGGVGKSTGPGEIFNTYSGDFMNIASGKYSHAEGFHTQANGEYSHAEGYYTRADMISGGYGATHAEGVYTHANGLGAHAEGSWTTAIEEGAHAEGRTAEAWGEGAHAEGGWTEAKGNYSHAGGFHTTAENYGLTTIGKYNIKDYNPIKDNVNNSKPVFVIATGSRSYGNDTVRVLYNGNVYIQGIGNYRGVDSWDNFPAEGVKSVQEVIQDLTNRIIALENKA